MLETEALNKNDIWIGQLDTNHFDDISNLWIAEYNKTISKFGFLPDCWRNKAEISSFVGKHINVKGSLVAIYKNEIVGYMTYDSFRFHNEMSAFIPIMAHVARQDVRNYIYLMMYKELSKRLVEEDNV